MKEVIILGHGPTRIQCPYDKETWGVNNCYSFAQRLDKLFITDRITEKEFDFKALEQVKCIVSSIPYPNHPEWNIEVYPLKEVLAKFRTTFFSNAICYMIAYALLKEYERIWFYGIDMMTSTTYLFEKGGVEYWMGIAHALGVPIINTKESATGKTIDGRMYGYWGDGLDNADIFSKAVAEESRRLVRNLSQGLPIAERAIADPDGHLLRKEQKMREILGEGELEEDTRNLIKEFPRFKDESEEWTKGANGNWVRKKQRIVFNR